MPPSLTAATGMDALAHAIESRVSRKGTEMTIPLSLRAAARRTRARLFFGRPPCRAGQILP